MRKRIHALITRLVQLAHRYALPAYSGSYVIMPKPPYVSQFIRIYPSSIAPDTVLTNARDIKAFGAKDGKEFTFWAWRDCGIACVKMILDAKHKAKHKTMMDLTREGVALGGYVVYEKGRFVDKGWFHRSLVALLKTYGVDAKMKKWQSIESVAKNVLENKLTVLSVVVPGRRSIKEDGSFGEKYHAQPGGHLLLATGVAMNGKEVEGVYVHDPRGLKTYQQDTYIPKKIFASIFTNRTIVVE